MPASLLRRPPLLLLAAVLVALTAAALFAGGAPTEAQSPATVTRTDPHSDKTIEVRAGKYYTIGLTSDDQSQYTAERGWIGEGNLGEFVVAVGEVPPAGGLAFVCSTVADSAGAADYVAGAFPINEQSGGTGTNDQSSDSVWKLNSDGEGGLQTLPIVTKSDYELEGDEYFWIECLPSRGSQKDEWRAWPSPRLRVRIVDDTTGDCLKSPANEKGRGRSAPPL